MYVLEVFEKNLDRVAGLHAEFFCAIPMKTENFLKWATIPLLYLRLLEFTIRD
jgi:hypothetical protein